MPDGSIGRAAGGGRFRIPGFLQIGSDSRPNSFPKGAYFKTSAISVRWAILPVGSATPDSPPPPPNGHNAVTSIAGTLTGRDRSRVLSPGSSTMPWFSSGRCQGHRPQGNRSRSMEVRSGQVRSSVWIAAADQTNYQGKSQNKMLKENVKDIQKKHVWSEPVFATIGV